MKGAKILLASSIVFTIYGGINIICCILWWLSASSVNPRLLDLDQFGFFFWSFLLIHGLIPFIVGGLGLFWHNTRDKVKIVLVLSYILLVVEFALFFMTYGSSWINILFSLGCIIVALIYFYAARKNYEEEKEFQKTIKKKVKQKA